MPLLKTKDTELTFCIKNKVQRKRTHENFQKPVTTMQKRWRDQKTLINEDKISKEIHEYVYLLSEWENTHRKRDHGDDRNDDKRTQVSTLRTARQKCHQDKPDTSPQGLQGRKIGI